MNKYLLVKLKSDWSKKNILLRILQYGQTYIPFRADIVHCYQFNDLLVFSAENTKAGGLRGGKNHVDTEGGHLLIFDGLPFIEDQQIENGWAKSLKSKIKQMTADEIFENLKGSYSLVKILNGSVIAFGDYSGLNPLFYINNDDVCAVSNRQMLLARICTRFDHFVLNYKSLSWLPGQSSIFGEDTVFAGVKLLQPGQYIQIEDSLQIYPFPLQVWSEEYRNLTSRDYDELTDILLGQARQINKIPFKRLIMSLTGGKDSRLVLALALESGLIDSVGEIFTFGREGSPEIETAAYIAKSLGLRHKARITKPSDFDLQARWKLLKYHVFQYEGSVCPWDGTNVPSKTNKSVLELHGFAGEIYKTMARHMFIDLRSPEDAMILFENYQQGTDPLQVMKPDFYRYQRESMHAMVQDLFGNGIRLNDLANILYINNRLTYWTGLLTYNIISLLRVFPLINFKATRLAYRGGHELRQTGRIHFEIMRRLNKDLTELPFLEKGWDARLHPYLQEAGIKITGPYKPKHEPISRNMVSWQWEFIDKGWDEIRSFLLDTRHSGLYDIINYDRLEKVLSSKNNIKTVLDAKELLSLISMQIFLTNQYIIDYQGADDEPEFMTNIEGIELFSERPSLLSAIPREEYNLLLNLEQKITCLYENPRWKIGHLLASIRHLKNKTAGSREDMELIFQKFHGWTPDKEQIDSDIHKLTGWIMELEQSFSALLDSKRWKTGDRVVSSVNRLLRRRYKNPVPKSVRSIQKLFADYHMQESTGKGCKNLNTGKKSDVHIQPEKTDEDGIAGEDRFIRVIDGECIERLTYEDPHGVAVIMPCTDITKGLETARIMVKRAGMKITVFVVEDTLGQGFIEVLNRTAAQINVKYIVYVTEDAFAGVDWLRLAVETLQSTGKDLLSFNCGRYGDRIATFGLVRREWVKRIYGGPFFFPEYKTTEAIKELTIIARAADTFVFNPDCALVKISECYTPGNENGVNAGWTQEDRELISQRFNGNFDGMFQKEELQPYIDEYLCGLKQGGDTVNLSLSEENSILLIDIKDVSSLGYTDPDGIAVIMPSINIDKAMNTARHLVLRSGSNARYFVVEDTLRQGFVKTLNDTAKQVDVKYLVFLAEDAIPGINWLKTAYSRLEETGKGLLAFNCGVWHGRIAAFGMVRMEWVRKLYGGPILFPGYRAHRADNELTVIARATDEFIYCAEALLIEYDKKRVFRKREADVPNFTPHDKELFISRFNAEFYGLAPFKLMKPLAATYNIPLPSFVQRLCRNRNTKTLKQNYAEKRLPGEDTFALYRIIGNDLYPRHKRGQSRENLLFILENEKTFEACEKRFIVNRIICPDEEQKIIDLLETYGAKYVRLPFDPDEYRRIDLDTKALEGLSRKGIVKFKEEKLQRLLLALYRLKNNYVMNINGARNFALREGRARSKWSLVFDGGCFITPSAWEQIRTDITAYPHLKYFVVPMTRVHSNTELLSEAFAPEPTEEPQLIFRKDSREEFNTAFPYGRRDKVEFLWRLRVAGKWDSYKDDPWDQKRPSPSPEARFVGVAGWVARLFTGMGHLETQDAKGARQRYLDRADAILSTLQSLDASFTEVTGTFNGVKGSAVNEKCKDRNDSMLLEVLEALGKQR